jgi:aryl-alcohol dehydrogenase-like predicted oxidoreductase
MTRPPKRSSIIPVVGSGRRAQLREALGALDIKLSADDLTRIARAVPAEAVAGTRHAEQLMNMLDSERTGASVS